MNQDENQVNEFTIYSPLSNTNSVNPQCIAVYIVNCVHQQYLHLHNLVMIPTWDFLLTNETEIDLRIMQLTFH